LEHHAVDDGEDGGGRADADAEGEDGKQGYAGRPLPGLPGFRQITRREFYPEYRFPDKEYE
jgi:hypothetical protein